jgi:hypothetical protein
MFIFLQLPVILYSQFFDKPQTGFSIRASINILPVIKNSLTRSGNEPKINFHVSASAGIGDYWADNVFYPSINLELQLYNGGFGAGCRCQKIKFPVQLDTILAFTLTSGFMNNNDQYALLRYFSDFATPSLKNPYSSSVSIGTNFIITTDSKKETLQRIGFINFNIEKFQLSYYNDGGFGIRQLQLGDGEDRYYTGGGTLSYDFVDNKNLISLELSAHKFTGYTKSAFDFSNETESKAVRYNDVTQYIYNKSLWRFNFLNQSSKNPGYGLSVSYFNSKNADIQYLIHRMISNSYHIILDRQYIYFEPIIMYKSKY